MGLLSRLDYPPMRVARPASLGSLGAGKAPADRQWEKEGERLLGHTAASLASLSLGSLGGRPGGQCMWQLLLRGIRREVGKKEQN